MKLLLRYCVSLKAPFVCAPDAAIAGSHLFLKEVTGKRLICALGDGVGWAARFVKIQIAKRAIHCLARINGHALT